AGERRVWTESVVGGRVAPKRDPGIRQAIDVVLEDAVVVVCEVIGPGWRKVQGPSQEGCRLTARHGAARTEPIVCRWIAPAGDPRRGQTIDITGVNGVVVVGEMIDCRCSET